MKTNNATDVKYDVGYKFPSVRVEITKEMIRENAEASFDFNPLHLDDEWMKTAQFGDKKYGSIIAHGLMTYSFVTRMITDELYPTGGWHERCEMRFIAPVFPGDTIVTEGTITHIRDEGDYRLYEAEVRAVNQNGVVCEAGTAVGRVPLGSEQINTQKGR